MQRRVEHELDDADAVLLVVNGEQGVGGRATASSPSALARRGGRRSSIAVNKIDRLDRTPHRRGAAGRRRPRPRRRGLPDLGPHRQRASSRSSTTSSRCCPRARSTSRAEEISDQPEHVLLAELVREQVLRRTRQEVPHAVEVAGRRDRASATSLVARARAAVGRDRVPEGDPDRRAAGAMIKAIGTAARRELERELGHARAPRPLGARAPLLARRRRAARPPRDQVANVNCGWVGVGFDPPRRQPSWVGVAWRPLGRTLANSDRTPTPTQTQLTFAGAPTAHPRPPPRGDGRAHGRPCRPRPRRPRAAPGAAAGSARSRAPAGGRRG